jgi:hypothetical protein
VTAQLRRKRRAGLPEQNPLRGGGVALLKDGWAAHAGRPIQHLKVRGVNAPSEILNLWVEIIARGQSLKDLPALDRWIEAGEIAGGNEGAASCRHPRSLSQGS